MNKFPIKIAAFILCYNEEKMLPHTIKHYKNFCEEIYIINNCSTDNTVKIALENNCKVINSPSNFDEINETNYLFLKSELYKEYRHLYDYIITCDADEFLYHKNIFDYLRNNNLDVLKCIGYDMIFNNFNFENNSYTQIIEGIPSEPYSKCAIFKSHINIRWDAGCHVCFVPHTQSEIELRHLKFINIDYLVERYCLYNKRLSQINKNYRWGNHYEGDEQTHRIHITNNYLHISGLAKQLNKTFSWDYDA